MEAGELNHALGESGKVSSRRKRLNYKECLWGSRKMGTERGCPVDLATWPLLVILTKPMETEWQGEWNRPKSTQVLTKFTGILMTSFYYSLEGSYFLHLLSCKSLREIVLVQLAPKLSR